MARPAKAPEVQQEQTNRIKVMAKLPPFVDLINDVRIGAEPVEVELHHWLQAQIDAGLLIMVE